jgi:pyruvate/2-oxoglutarate dehydrogenase complex dihydrolipoamide dehydrogenase (E3) component
MDFYDGFASFIDEKSLKVNGEVVTGKTIFINVGTRPVAPPIEGIQNVPWLDSERLLELKELPNHLIIIGGGYIGVEFGQVFRRFGSEVTILQRGSQLMPKEDADVAESILDILTEEKIEIKLNSNVITVEATSGNINLTYEQDSLTHKLKGSHILVAAGRKPNSDTLELQNAGIETDERGYIKIDEYCRTNVEGVFALGDVNGHGAFTHTSVNDAEVVIDYLFGGKRSLKTRIPVYALFSDPPLGRVGLTEKEALERGHSVLKATKPMREISRAKEMGETKGFAKLLVDAETDMIIGAAILGPGGDEVINMFAAIMHSNIPCKNYREVVLVHPTISELMPWVLDGLKPL